MAEVRSSQAFVYRISPEDEWAAAQATGALQGGELDATSGYVHLSTAAQVTAICRRQCSPVLDSGYTYRLVNTLRSVRWLITQYRVFTQRWRGPLHCSMLDEPICTCSKLTLLSLVMDCAMMKWKVWAFSHTSMDLMGPLLHCL